jgi:protein tyrosine/serine phosphatase
MWIDLDGLVNLRDVGGIPTIDGGKIIPGRLLRSDNLQTLTNSDVDQLLGLGLTDVVDLRRKAPHRWQRPAYGSISSRCFASGRSGSVSPSPTYGLR